MDYSSTGGMKSPFSPRVRQSISGRRPIGLSSSKKNQSKYAQSPQQESGDVIYKIGHSTIETYGMPLPVMVTEALTFASGDVSVRMSPCGWCWVVTGRRVLAWPQEATGSSSGPTAARELTLPQTDLAHKADLVMIFYEDNEQAMPSCVGVSPEGVVRYWASVGQEGAYSEITCELAGQECDRLVARTDESGATVGSLLLATTTCTLVRIHTSREGRPTVTCQMLRPPSGWLGGIGRRVSLLFFGSMPAHADTKLVGVVILPPLGSSEEDNSELVCMVAGGPLLQLWGGAGLHEHHLRRPLVDAFARAHLAPHGEPSTMEIMALDVHPIGDRMLLLLVVLVAAFNQSRPSDMRYALAQVSVEQPESPRVVALCGVAVRAGDEPPRCAPLAPLPPARALLYWPSALALVPADRENQRDKNKTFTLDEIESNLLAYGGLVSRTQTKFNMNFIKFLDTVDQETNVTNILLKLSPDCGDMLVYCEWKNRSIPCRHIFGTRMTPHGFCCLMNSRYAPEDSSRKPMYLHSHNYGTGLLVVVQEDVDDFMFLRRLGTDTEVIIFGGNQYPIQDSSGVRSFPAPKNYLVSVKLKTRRQEVSSGVIFDENLSGCLAHGPPDPLCLVRCRRGAAAALCSCVPPALLPARTDKVCTPEYLKCIVKHREMLLQYFPGSSLAQGAAEEMSDSVDCRHCRPHCAHAHHEARLTRQRVDTGERYFLDQYTKKLVNYPNSTMVHIYFASDRQEFYSVGVTYRWFDFAIYISNHWMTILGMGLINFCEVIYFSTFRWYHHYQRRKESMELTLELTNTFKHL